MPTGGPMIHGSVIPGETRLAVMTRKAAATVAVGARSAISSVPRLSTRCRAERRSPSRACMARMSSAKPPPGANGPKPTATSRAASEKGMRGPSLARSAAR